MANQNNNKGGQQQDVNQLLKVRREKLQNLQEAGKDPFQITKYNVTHHSSDVKELYNAHEAEILGDRKAPDVEGLDDAAKREVINNDYNERNHGCKANRGKHRRTYDVQACHGQGFFLQYPGFKGQYPGICGKGQCRRRLIRRLQEIRHR